MSFDLFFFRLRENTSLDDVDKYFMEAPEEQEDEENDDRETPFDRAFTREELTRRVARPFLSVVVPPGQRSAELERLLSIPLDQEIDDEALGKINEVESYLEWMEIGIEGIWMMGVSYGADFDMLSQAISRTIDEIIPHGIHIFDPQEGQCIRPQG